MNGCDMHRRELYIEAQVTKIAQARGWRVRKMEFVGRRGCPDRWFFKGPGLVRIIEFKDPNGALSAAQKKEIGWLRANGFDVHVVSSVEDGRALFDADPEREADPDDL